MANRAQRIYALTALQMLKNLDEMESDGGSEITPEIDVSDDDSSSESDIDPPPPMPEPRRRKTRKEPTETPCRCETRVCEGWHDFDKDEQQERRKVPFAEYPDRGSRPNDSR
ncbi:hypothetical protein DPEC_G00018740 [Dallia pectoralis]|uniref:Uncharacterized protein n=1 Tax=Dallia pectoralis TaxID=75939 RepID=A0ACC2HFI1_DALPE|nr:hypothetical protein DPEC_G00018740 [Dallia pectoralis]